MNKKEYNVVIIGSTKKQDIETEQMVTNDIKKAIKEAGNWDYDLVEF